MARKHFLSFYNTLRHTCILCRINTHTHTHTPHTDHIPIDVCFVPRIRQLLPSRSLFSRKKVPQGLPLKSEDRDRIFLMARNPDEFYKTIVNLQVSNVHNIIDQILKKISVLRDSREIKHVKILNSDFQIYDISLWLKN